MKGTTSDTENENKQLSFNFHVLLISLFPYCLPFWITSTSWWPTWWPAWQPSCFSPHTSIDGT